MLILFIGLISIIIIGFIIVRNSVKQIENKWRKVCWDNHNNWKAFHQQEIHRWQKEVEVLIQQVRQEEYDRLLGKNKKPKMPTN